MKIKQVWVRVSFLIGVLCMGSACGRLPTAADFVEDHNRSDDPTSPQFSLKCGQNTSNLVSRISIPPNWAGNLFAILLNASPGTFYLGDTIQLPIKMGMLPANVIDPYQGLVQGLMAQGYKVIESQYIQAPKACGNLGDMDGFYAVCCAQGIEASIEHNAALYDALVRRLGFDTANPQHQLIGFGVSLGALQIETAAFISGRKFTSVGLTGVLLGNGEQGCASGRLGLRDGLAWTSFMNNGDAITKSTQGCSQTGGAAPEYNRENSRFSSFPYARQGRLGLFEGTVHQPQNVTPDVAYLALGLPLPAPALISLPTQIIDILGLPGTLGQARLIRDIRNNDLGVAPNLTVLRDYRGCGHEVLGCSQRGRRAGERRALDEILDFFRP